MPDDDLVRLVCPQCQQPIAMPRDNPAECFLHGRCACQVWEIDYSRSSPAIPWARWDSPPPAAHHGSTNSWSVDAPTFSYVPQLSVVALYGAFFVFGWFLHRHAEQLGTLFHQWRLYLIGGLLVSFGTFAIHYRTNPADVDLPLHSVSYRDVTDWSAFLNSLRALENADESKPAHQQLWTLSLRTFATPSRKTPRSSINATAS